MMDDYGIYVWSAYGITLCILGLNMFFTLHEKNKILRLLKQNFYES